MFAGDPRKGTIFLLLAINGTENSISDAREAEILLDPLKNRDDLEIWVYGVDGSSLSALLNSHRGWLMFLRFSGDAGFSSRNRTDDHDESETEDFVLANGQVDSYPRTWTFERDAIFDAILEFVRSGTRSSLVDWHDDGAK